MVDDKKEDKTNIKDEKKSDEEKIKKKKFTLPKPKPIFFIIISPAILVLISYIVLNRIYLPKEELHEVKIQKVLEEKKSEMKIDQEEGNGSIEENLLEDEQIKDENGMVLFDTHNYYQFEIPFAINVKDSKNILTFDLAISTFQTAITASFFLENFVAFVPALRSEVLKELSKYNYDELKSSISREDLLKTLKKVMNKKLEELGSEPSIDKVFFVNYVLT